MYLGSMQDRCTPVPCITLTGTGAHLALFIVVSHFVFYIRQQDIIYGVLLDFFIHNGYAFQRTGSSIHFIVPLSFLSANQKELEMKLIRNMLLASILASVEASPLGKAVRVVDSRG